MTTYSGTSGDDTISGGTEDDKLLGGGGDDELTGGEGDDFIHGGTGIDTAIFSGSVTQYTWRRSGENLYLTGIDGEDRLVHVEFAQFDDALVDLDSNNAPIAFADTASLTEDDGGYSSGSASVLDNDLDWEGDALSVTPGTFTGTYGTLTMNADGTYSYSLHPSTQSLAQGTTAQDVFSYTVSDASSSSTGTLTFSIAGLNDAPVAAADSAAGHENQLLAIDVLANDADVDDGAVLTIVAASAPKGSVAISGGQIHFDPGADFDHLAVGDSETVIVDYTIEDEHGASSSSTIEITVTGTNDGPVANADSASTGENATVLIDVLANDTDADDGAVLTVTAASAPKGSASVVGNQVEFDPGTDFDHLAAGANEIVTVSYTIEDEHGVSSSSTIEITVTGTNDGPVANADTASTGENAAVLIDVLANDTDADDGAVLTVTAASSPKGSASVSGNQVQFDPGTDFDHLAVGQSETVTLSYTIEDENGASAGSTVEVTVTGANDGVTIDAGGTTATGSVTELPNNDPNENAFTHQASGTVAYDDPDLADVHAATATADGAGYLGTFTLDPVDQSGDSIGWSFEVDDSAIDFLDAGESLVQTYTIEVSDGNGGTATQQVTVTINGADDNTPPDAVDDSYAATGNATLTVSASAGLLANDSDDAGMGDDPGETPVTSYDSTSANGGTVTVNPDGSFSYTSAPGFTGTDSFTYTVTDAEGETDTATVTVEVTGSVWFIDNAAVGSANLGTQADPYTSIAAFNAAQGTANGPAAGETVYLREGTGTYAEADGINLLDGQTLIGGGQDLVVGGDTIETGTGRPTIVTTGGGNHGVELAQNNNVSGLDIGDTTGAGISDGNGSVGVLTVSDVGISGLGQIADIDQGGTLNVTLNGASSTASADGAIDLAGVGGTFTIAGAVVIAGSHAGGGIDITGSSLTFTLAGGGSIATGAAAGVNFVGNSGTFAAGGGGLAIVTTTGTGFSASGGGTVTVTGAGNSITAAGGTALSVAGTTIGAGGLIFESISANGGATAIELADTGTLGGLTVTGTGTAGSGGIIQNTGGAAISITNGQDLNLDWMTILNPAGTAIFATNLGGANSVSNSTITGFGFGGVGTENGIRIANTDTDMASFTVNGTTIAGGGSGNDGILMVALGTSDMTLRVHNSTFTGMFGDGIQVSGVTGTSGTVNVSVIDSSFVNAAVSGNGGVVLTPFGGMTLNALIEGNLFDDIMRPSTTLGAISGTNGGGSTANITIRDNVIEDLPGSRGITFTADSGTANLLIDQNVIDRLGSTSKHAIAVVYIGTAAGDVSVTDNQIGQNGNLWTAGNGFANGILLQTQSSASMTALISGNEVTANTSFEVVRVRAIQASTLNATVTGNTLTDTAGSHIEFDATAGTSLGTAVVNLHLDGNVLPAAGVGVIRLTDGTGGVLSVTQADPAAVSAANSSATVTPSGTIVYGQPAPPLPSDPALPPAPLLAGARAVGEMRGELLDQATLDAFVEAAIQRWIDAGATAEQVEAMRAATFTVTDLTGQELGLTTNGAAIIDVDAAGFGWLLDDTPADEAEFGAGWGPAGMDLLTVLMHELGHVAGLGDRYLGSDVGDLMFGYLMPGERRLPDLLGETDSADGVNDSPPPPPETSGLERAFELEINQAEALGYPDTTTSPSIALSAESIWYL